MLSQLDGFAQDLHILLTTGAPLVLKHNPANHRDNVKAMPSKITKSAGALA